MKDKNPALFYFYSHDSAEELKTDTCRELVQRADVLFREGTTPDVFISEEIERDLNDYSRDGILSEKLRLTLEADPDGEDAFLLGLTRGTAKKYVLENYPEAPFDLEAEEKESDEAFLRYSLEDALHARAAFLSKEMPYNIQREKAAAKKISAIDGTVLGIFGSAHPDIRKMVARVRPTEAHFPYADYPNSYDSQEILYFRKTGMLDVELFLKHQIEDIARKALQGYPYLSRRERDAIANHYARVFPASKIPIYKDYLNFCVSFSRVSPQDVFESFLKKESLPLVSEMLAKIKKV